MGDGFYRSKDPTNPVQSTEGRSCKGKETYSFHEQLHKCLQLFFLT